VIRSASADRPMFSLSRSMGQKDSNSK